MEDVIELPAATEDNIEAPKAKSPISSRSPSATIRRISLNNKETDGNNNTNRTLSSDSVAVGARSSVGTCSRPSSVASNFSLGPEGLSITEFESKEIVDIFNTFDHNGGGSLDLQDLRRVLKNNGIRIPLHELKKITPLLHKNEEPGINFNEFLIAIVNSSHLIANLGSRLKYGKPAADRVFRLVLEFLRISAFRCVAEAESKKDVQRGLFVPNDHVVNDYSAGAKNRGLPDRIVYEKMAQIKEQNNAYGSRRLSYAEPLHMQGHDPVAFHKMKTKGRITLVVRIGNAPLEPYLPTKVRHHKVAFTGPVPNWRSQRTENIAVNLPHVYLTPLLPFEELTEDNMPVIRNQVNKATNEFRATKRKNFISNSLRHFDNLHEELITSEPLRYSFRTLFSTYTDIGIHRLPPLLIY